MQPGRLQPRAPGSFSPLSPSISSAAAAAAAADFSSARPRARRQKSSSSDDSAQLSPKKTRPSAVSFTTSQSNASAASLTNFSRPTAALSPAALAARSVSSVASVGNELPTRNTSPLTLPPGTPSSGGLSSAGGRVHARKHSHTAGHFDSTLPSTSTSNLSQVTMAQPAPRELSASQIAAQAAVLHHQSQQQQLQVQLQQAQLQQNRHRSQTVPTPGADSSLETASLSSKRGSGGPGPLSPPMLSLTEASAPREHGFGSQGYRNGLLGDHTSAAATAANMVFPRSGQSSPGVSPQPQQPPQMAPPSAMPPPEKPLKSEKSKVKLFSRPGKIGTKGDPKDKPLPSPGKLGSALANLQRGNFSTTSLDAPSFYSHANSSAATIRPADATPSESSGREKEKKHNFLSRQKHKLKDKDDFHLPLSSAASNSRPTDPHAPSSLYNFNLVSGSAPNSTPFKSMSGLDLRHGARVLRDKKKDDRGDANDPGHTLPSDWPGPSSLGSTAAQSSLYLMEPLDTAKYGLNNMSLDDAWPYLKAKLLVIFEGEDLRLPVEDFNRVVLMHLQYCIQRRSPNIIVDDLRELLATGFSSLDRTLRKTPPDRMIPVLVELWLFSFTSILPYIQAVFLPLDLEFAGAGSLLTADQARDFWGGVLAATPDESSVNVGLGGAHNVNVSPAAAVLDVRRLVLTAYRDTVILPRYDTLKTMFSRHALEFLPQSLASMALASPLPIGQDLTLMSTSPSADSMASYGFGSAQRPGTAMSLDPSNASYNSTSTTLFGDGSAGGSSRSRAISNVSFGSGASDGNNNTTSLLRPFTTSGLQALGGSGGAGAGAGPGPGAGAGGGGVVHHQRSGSLGGLREQNVEDSKQVTEMVGRMLQCMSVLASAGVAGDGDEGARMVEELSRLLKLNWLGRGRTGRNRRGIVGGRVRRAGTGTGIGIPGSTDLHQQLMQQLMQPPPPPAREEVRVS